MIQSLFINELNNIKIFTDGGSRGNPGLAAIGVYIDINGSKKSFGQVIGTTTNNVAEYEAMIFGLKKIKQLIGKTVSKQATISAFADSELLIKQLNGVYKIEDENLQKLWMQIWNLKMEFKEVKFAHVRREFNKDADKMVNLALDGKL